jgi:hypothetical protein
VPKTAGKFGTAFNQSLSGIGPPAASAIGSGGGSRAQIGGDLNIKIDAPGLRARVTKQESFGGLGLDVETGYAMAGAG